MLSESQESNPYIGSIDGIKLTLSPTIIEEEKGNILAMFPFISIDVLVPKGLTSITISLISPKYALTVTSPCKSITKVSTNGS